MRRLRVLVVFRGSWAGSSGSLTSNGTGILPAVHKQLEAAVEATIAVAVIKVEVVTNAATVEQRTFIWMV